MRASAHRLGQRASLAVYQRADRLDGIRYPSRLNGDENLAIYDRAVPKLSAGPRLPRACPNPHGIPSCADLGARRVVWPQTTGQLTDDEPPEAAHRN